MSLRNTFKTLAGKILGAEENPVTSLSHSEFTQIKKILDEKRVDLVVRAESNWPLGELKNIGLAVPKNTGIMTILHAEGNLCKAFEDVTGKPLEKDNIKKYEHIPPEAYYFPMM